MLVSDVVAVVVALNVVDERLEVEVGQLVHHVEHDVLIELVVQLWRPRQHRQVAAVLGQASVHHSVVLIISVNDGTLQPLVVLVAHETLSALEMSRAIHFTMAAIVWSKCRILAHSVLHEAATVVH